MCRFTFYQGEPIRLSALVTEPEHSLDQSELRLRARAKSRSTATVSVWRGTSRN